MNNVSTRDGAVESVDVCRTNALKENAPLLVVFLAAFHRPTLIQRMSD